MTWELEGLIQNVKERSGNKITGLNPGKTFACIFKISNNRLRFCIAFSPSIIQPFFSSS